MQQTALTMASWNGHAAVVKVLLEHGADLLHQVLDVGGLVYC